jgi:hypothetical protein
VTTPSPRPLQPAGNIRAARAFAIRQLLEVAMNNRDETIREKLLERLTAVNVDARNLAVEVTGGTLVVRGSVPAEDQRQRAMEALAGAHTIEILVRPVAPIDSEDGRGRSPSTGTSAESAHHGRHQTDPT